MKIQNGMFSKVGLQEEYLSTLTDIFSKTYPEAEGVEITLAFQDEKGQHLRAILDYTHPLARNKKSTIIIDPASHSTPFESVNDLLEKWQSQQNCNHDFQRTIDRNGVEFPDGRCTCSKCELDLDRGLEPIPNKRIIKLSMGDKAVVAQYDWGEAGLQGGDKGLVLSRKKGKSYTTSFVEAFPTIHGYGTFIRGEGANIQKAEQACWEKYQKRLACDNHEWSRIVNGRERTDGYAQCIHCGLATSDALRPSTTCLECGEPTTNKLDGKYLCYTHYFEKDENSILHDALAGAKKWEKDAYNEDKETLDVLIEHRFMKPFHSELGELEFQDHESQLRQVGYHFSSLVLHTFFSIHPFKTPANGYPNADNDHIKVCLKHAHANMSHIISYLKGEQKSLSNKYLIPESYTRNFA